MQLLYRLWIIWGNMIYSWNIQRFNALKRNNYTINQWRSQNFIRGGAENRLQKVQFKAYLKNQVLNRQGQGQGLDPQGQGQGQGLDPQGQGQGKASTLKAKASKFGLKAKAKVKAKDNKPDIYIYMMDWTVDTTDFFIDGY